AASASTERIIRMACLLFLAGNGAGWCDRKGMRGRAPHKTKADPAAGWICLDLIAVDLLPEPDVDNAGRERAAAVLRMPVRHQFWGAGRTRPDQVSGGVMGFFRQFN